MTTESAPVRRELVFGFVAPLGVERERIVDALRRALDAAKYSLEAIHVSETLTDFVDDPDRLKTPQFLERKELLMDAGDAMRREWSRAMGEHRADAVGLAAILKIRQKRKEVNERLGVKPIIDVDERKSRDLPEIPLSSVAYLIDSLKHPDELERLRAVYGPAFISLSIYAPPGTREHYLDRKSLKADKMQRLAPLMERDARGQEGDDEYGQRVSDAFDQTDFIVDASVDDRRLDDNMLRLVELVFGNVHLTPSLDEFGMYLARSAQVRSGSLARQTGAAILRNDGSVVAVGTNEVPKPIVGGQYWPEDDDEEKHIGRDRVYHEFDTSDEFRADIMRDILDKLAKAELLPGEYLSPKMDSEGRLRALYYDKTGRLNKTKLRNNIDYVRAVHAEAAALLDCARHGVAVRGAQMFATTFPCHECSRHIVAAGIRRVVYLEPYPKSGTGTLYKDSIVIDPTAPSETRVVFTTFVGVAPARYLEFFSLGDRKRKTPDGRPISFALGEQSHPRLPYYAPPVNATIYNELQEVDAFTRFLADHKLAMTTISPPNAGESPT